MSKMTVAEGIALAAAKRAQGNWYPGTGEQPFVSRGGHRLLYVWQPSTGNKAYINLDTDIILSDEEARASLQLY